MKITFVVAGAALLVAGAALIAFSPFYVSTGFYKEELNQIQSGYNSSSSASFASAYSSYANTGEQIALAGVVMSPLGAALLAYGISSRITEEKQKQLPAAEATQAQ